MATTKRILDLVGSLRPLVDRPPAGYRWGLTHKGESLIVKLRPQKPVAVKCRRCGKRRGFWMRALWRKPSAPGLPQRLVGYECIDEVSCIRRAIGQVLRTVEESIAKCRGKRSAETLRAYRNGLRVGFTAAGGMVPRD